MFSTGIGSRYFDAGLRELGSVPFAKPAWEDAPELYPIDTIPWAKRVEDNHTLDPVGMIDVNVLHADGNRDTTDFNFVTTAGVTATRNGINVVDFDGANNAYVDTSDAVIDPDWTIFTVFKPRAFSFTDGTVDGDGVWATSSYYAGHTLYDDAGTSKVKLFVFDSMAGEHKITVPVYPDRWITTTSRLSPDNVLSLTVNTGTPAVKILPAGGAANTTQHIVLGQNPFNALYGNMILGVWALYPTGGIPAARERDIQRYYMAKYGPTKRCITMINGVLNVLPKHPPYGERISISSGVLTDTPSTGKSLALASGVLSQSTNEDDVEVPPLS